jgi:transcriptional regulator with GAF, ATPase, and Fis domain
MTTTRHDLEAALFRSEEFERTVADIAASFVNIPPDKVDGQVVDSLARMSALMGAERSSLWQPVADGTDLVFTHAWRGDDQTDLPLPERFSAETMFPWILARVRQGETVAWEQLREIPSETDRASFNELGVRSGISVPIVIEDRLAAILAFGMCTHERAWPAYALQRLPLLAAVFGSALARKQVRQELEAALLEVQRLRDQLAVENVQLRREVRTLKGSRVLTTDSLAMRQVVAQIEQVAQTPATVLMLGETGSGKEVFAEALHELSPRRQKPMVRVNCAAIPAALIESELFGRERGAYTGALSRQLGRFEVADGSTIFLDEVGELPLDMQVKLLRVLQDRVIERLGSSQPIRVNVRIIAATNRDLEQAVLDKTFREDLYYRLNVFPIRIPALRERIEDIPALVWSFVNEFASSFGKNIESISKPSLQALQAYGWPGNVRELRNIVERAVIVANSPTLTIEPPRPTTVARTRSLKFVDVEIDHLRAVLESTGWRIRGAGGASDLLGIKPTTLESRMAKLGIVRGGKTEPGADGGRSSTRRH